MKMNIFASWDLGTDPENQIAIVAKGDIDENIALYEGWAIRRIVQALGFVIMINAPLFGVGKCNSKCWRHGGEIVHGRHYRRWEHHLSRWRGFLTRWHGLW